GVEVVGECASGDALAPSLRRLAPDVVFLDIQMPHGSGFDALASLRPEAQPAIVFVTAYERHALQAFDVDAVDYLLKPVSRERLQRALERVRAQRAAPASLAPAERQGEFPRGDLLMVKDGNGSRLLRAGELDFLVAEGNYVRVHAAGRSFLMRDTLDATWARLDPRRFVRLHRDTLVNLERVVALRPLFSGQAEAVLRDGTCLRVSRRCRRKLE